jgi:hypothetical protein
MLVKMIPMHVVEMANMNIVDVTIVAGIAVWPRSDPYGYGWDGTFRSERPLISISCLFVRGSHTDRRRALAHFAPKDMSRRIGDTLGLLTSKFGGGDEPSRFIRI